MSWVEMVKKGSTIPDLHHLNLVRVVCYWATLTYMDRVCVERGMGSPPKYC
jgi:hypothetical protein